MSFLLRGYFVFLKGLSSQLPIGLYFIFSVFIKHIACGRKLLDIAKNGFADGFCRTEHKDFIKPLPAANGLDSFNV